MKPRIDPSTRTLLEPAPTLPTPGPLPTSPGRGFVELCARTSFSGVTIEGYGTVDGRSVHDARAAWPGAGLPEEVVTRAAVFGQDTVAIADIDTVAGVVRAHDRGKELGVGVIPGCELLFDEGSLVRLSSTATPPSPPPSPGCRERSPPVDSDFALGTRSNLSDQVCRGQSS